MQTQKYVAVIDAPLPVSPPFVTGTAMAERHYRPYRGERGARWGFAFLCLVHFPFSAEHIRGDQPTEVNPSDNHDHPIGLAYPAITPP